MKRTKSNKLIQPFNILLNIQIRWHESKYVQLWGRDWGWECRDPAKKKIKRERTHKHKQQCGHYFEWGGEWVEVEECIPGINGNGNMSTYDMICSQM